jgi:hypothetical protein
MGTTGMTIGVAVVLSTIAAYWWLTRGPRGFRARFARDTADALARQAERSVVTEADLERCPLPVQRYLREVGVVGQPRVLNYRLRFRGRIRSAPDARWMPFEAEQLSVADPPARFFLMRARMFGVPVEAFHRFVGGHATMQVKLAGAIPLVDAHGEDMDRSETVTLFNDMCLLAPATLIDSTIAWDAVDQRTVRARFSSGAQTISATVCFGDDGLLTTFMSDDRSRSSPDGKVFTRLPFSTPVRGYRLFGAIRLAAHGEARWTLPSGAFTYGEFDLQEVTYNVGRTGDR